MATKKATGATKLGRNSLPKYLGVKLYEGQAVKPGMIIIRQRGTHFYVGKDVKMGGDNTLYAMKEGFIRFQTKKLKAFDGSKRSTKIVNVEAKKSGK